MWKKIVYTNQIIRPPFLIKDVEFSTNDITDVTEIQFIKLLWGMKEIVLT